jgi:hypothetical protein
MSWRRLVPWLAGFTKEDEPDGFSARSLLPAGAGVMKRNNSSRPKGLIINGIY